MQLLWVSDFSAEKDEGAVIEDNIVALDPVPGRVVPNAKERSMINMEIHIPSDLEEAQLRKGPTFQWSSYAVDDNGVEVEELDYLQNFQKRYNKVKIIQGPLPLLMSFVVLKAGILIQYTLLKWE